MKSFFITFALVTAGMLVAGGIEVATRPSPEGASSAPKSCCAAAKEGASQTNKVATNAACDCGGDGCNCINGLCGGTRSCGCGGTECSCSDNICRFAGTYYCCDGTHYDGSSTRHCNSYCSRSTCDACNCPVSCRCK